MTDALAAAKEEVDRCQRLVGDRTQSLRLAQDLLVQAQSDLAMAIQSFDALEEAEVLASNQVLYTISTDGLGNIIISDGTGKELARVHTDSDEDEDILWHIRYMFTNEV